MSPLVYIITLNWNNVQDTLRCLESIGRLSYDNFRVIVVDNGSQEDPKEILKAATVPFDFIANSTNQGYAGGNNVAIRHALDWGADYVWLLNNDAMTEPDTLGLLIAAMQADSRIGMASPIIRYFPSGEIEYAAEMIDLKAVICTGTTDLAEACKWQEIYAERMVLLGTALLISKECLTAIGFFDENLFAYWEDTDISIRANAAGFRNFTVFDACVHHAKPPRTDPRFEAVRKPHFYYYMTRNEFLIWRKHVIPKSRLRASMWSIRRAMNKIERFRETSEVRDACLLGIWDGLNRKVGPYLASRRIRQPWSWLWYAACRTLSRMIA